MSETKKQGSLRRKLAKLAAYSIVAYCNTLFALLLCTFLLNLWWNALYGALEYGAYPPEYTSTFLNSFGEKLVLSPFRVIYNEDDLSVSMDSENATIKTIYNISNMVYVIPSTYFAVAVFFVGGLIQLNGAIDLLKATKIGTSTRRSYRITSRHLRLQYVVLLAEMGLVMVFNVVHTAWEWHGLMVIMLVISAVTAIRMILLLVVALFRKELILQCGIAKDLYFQKNKSKDVQIPISQ